MEPRTVITATRRTPLGDVVTVRKSFADDRSVLVESITVECPLELSEPGRTWPEQTQ